MVRGAILIVEDDQDILRLLSYNIRIANYDALTATDGKTALEIARQHHPDLIILDIVIPGINGFEVCKELKQNSKTKDIPVIMLSALSGEKDRVVGFEVGADDYMVKPFSLRELILRIGIVLRRSIKRNPQGRPWKNDWLRVDFEAHKAEVDGVEVPLTVTEFKLLSDLVSNLGKVRTRDQLQNNVWPSDFDGYARTVDTHVRRLRHKLGQYSSWIETVRSVGYRFRE